MNAPEGPVSPEAEADERTISPILPIPSKISNLRNLVDSLQGILCLQRVPGNVVQAQSAVTSAKAKIRDPDPLAIKTEISNPGGGPDILVFEAGVVVAVCLAGDQIELAERGKLLLEAQALSMGSSYITVLTHQRGTCGDIIVMTAPDNEPIGSFLL